MAGLKLANLPEDRARAEHVPEAEEVVDSAFIDIEAVAGERPEGGYLGSEGDAAKLFGQEERFDAKRIANQTQGAGKPIPNRGGIHALQP